MDAALDPACGSRALLANPSFVRLWVAGGLGNAMRWLELLVAGIFAWDAAHSAMAVALVTVARSLPMLLVGAIAGAIAEATSRKALLVGGFFIMAANAAVLWLLAAEGALELWHVVVGGVVAGTVWATDMAVRRRMVGEVVHPSRLSQAVALDSVTNSVTRMVGPMLGGVAFEAFGLAGSYLVSTLILLAGAILSAGLVFTQERQPLALARIPGDIVQGLVLARSHKVIRQVLLITIVMNAFGFSYTVLIAPLGLHVFAVSPLLVGLLAAAEPAGAVLNGLALAAGLVKEPHPRVMIAGTSVFLACVVGAALAPWYGLAWLVLFVGGLGTAAFSSMQSTLVLAAAPPAMRSRLMGIITVCIGTGPLGVLAAGALSDRLGEGNAMLAMALTGLAALGFVALSARHAR
jgi:MFS family permease